MVPPEADVIILGKLVDPVVNTETTMVSAVSTFARKTGLLMAYGLVKPENECIPLSLMNTTDRPCRVKKWLSMKLQLQMSYRLTLLNYMTKILKMYPQKRDVYSNLSS